MENKNETAIEKSPLEKIKSGLMTSGALSLYADNLPGVTGSAARAAAQAHANMMYTAVVNNPAIQGCTIRSLAKCGGESASVNLPVDIRGLAYLIPYKNKGVMEAQFQIGYLGLIELAYRSGKVTAISAHCVYESEKETVKIERINGRFHVEHAFSYEAPQGKMVAVYATAEIEGLGPQTMVLRVDQVETLRSNSKAPNSPAWKDHYEAMAKKSAIRQLGKFLPKSILPEFSRAAAMDARQTFGEAQAESEAEMIERTGKKHVDVKMTDAESDTDGHASDEEFMEGADDPDTKAEAEKQKAKLAAADVQGKLVCQSCASTFDETMEIKKGKRKWRGCPECNSKGVIGNPNYVNEDAFDEPTEPE